MGRRMLATIVAVGLCSMALAATSTAATKTTGAMSAFGGRVSCQWVKSNGVTTVRCWALIHKGQNVAVSTGDKSGRFASTMWHPPVGPAMVFNHKYNLGNGVTCSYRWHHVTDTEIIRSVICGTSAGGPLIFARPEGLAVDLA
jgi:hypothetical protein